MLFFSNQVDKKILVIITKPSKMLERTLYCLDVRFVIICFRLLKGAEEIFLKKRLKREHGGQLRDFFMEDAVMYENIESSADFFTTQERQQITLHLLNNIRVTKTQKILGHIMVEGQAIGNYKS